MSRKAAFQVYAWFWIITAFVLAVIFFFILFSLFERQVQNKIDSEFKANDANIAINNLLYAPVEYEGREMSMAELLDEYQSSGQRVGWLYEPKQAGFINDKFTEHLKQVYGQDVKWKLQIRFDDERKQHALRTITHGTFLKTGESITQVIPSSNKQNIIIEFWPP